MQEESTNPPLLAAVGNSPGNTGRPGRTEEIATVVAGEEVDAEDAEDAGGKNRA